VRTVVSQLLTPVGSSIDPATLVPLWLLLRIGIVDLFSRGSSTENPRHTVTGGTAMGYAISVSKGPSEVPRDVRATVLAFRVV
jgi:hypothetical protein